jgi:uncharacterized protein (TIGR02145 family)
LLLSNVYFKTKSSIFALLDPDEMKRVLPFFHFLFLITVLLCGPAKLIASNKQGNLLKHQDETPGFIENKGQIIDQKNNPNPAVLYLMNTPGMNVQLRKGGFSYDLYAVSSRQSSVLSPQSKVGSRQSAVMRHDSIVNYPLSIINYDRIDITLLGSNPECSIIPSDPLTEYFNYFTSNCPPEGIKNVRQYSRVTYKDIYPDIDLVFSSTGEHGYEYNFVIHPGGNINDIRLSITGPEDISLIRDTLRFGTRFGDLEELIPESYYMVNDSRVDVKARFKKIDNDVYGFAVNKSIPENSLLVIDPTAVRLWGTYYGGSQFEVEGQCAVDKSGNVFLTGYTKSTNNIASSGSYQPNLIGLQDAFLAKFNAAGQRLWGTYFGGGSEYLWYGSIVVDKSGNIYFAGSTSSTSGIASPGAHQTVYGGGPSDCFLEKFNQAGTRDWGTYYGGASLEQNGGVTTDKNGNVFLTGETKSDTGIATAGAYQPNIYNSTSTDAFLAKFDSNGVRQWGTYYGGPGSDGGSACAIDRSGNVYFCGYTGSAANIASPGAWQTIYGGDQDAFLAKFTTGGQRTWATYYGGSGDDDGVGCTVDSAENICLVGFTNSTDSIASPGCFQPVFGGGTYDGFLIKFDSSGQRLWGTYYGGSLEDEVNGCTIGWNNEIFMAGWTASTNNISTPDAYQPVFGGFFDGMLIKFNAAGQRLWGTYYGGSGQESFWNCSYVTDDTIYAAGNAESTNNIASPGAWQQVYGGNQDDMLIKFLDCWPIDTAGPITGPTNLCKPSTGVSFSIPPVTHAVNYVWTLPFGITITSGTGTNSIITDVSNSALSGTIWVQPLNKCDSGATAYLFITVNQAPVPVISGPDTTCAGPGKVYSTAAGKTNYQWSTSAGGIITSGGSTTDNTATITWTATGNQDVYVNYSDGGCEASAPTDFSVWVTSSPAVNVTISASANNICSGTQVTFTAIPTNGGSNPSYQWKVNGANAGTNSPNFTYTPLNNCVITCVLTSSITGCIMNNPATSNAIIIVVNPILAVSLAISASSNPFCQGSTITFSATPTNGGTTPSYQWKVNSINVGTNNPVYSYIPANGDIVSCVLNSSVPCPTGNPATSNTITMTEDNNVIVSVSITPSLNPVCAGTSVIFTATPVNGGSAPVYQWKVNGINAGTNNPTYSYIPVNGDLVTCVLTSNAACASGNPATSNTVTMTVNPNLPVSITISASANPVCQGSTVTFTGSPVNGGIIPTFQWKVNGNSAGTNNPTYSYIPTNGDLVSCILTSSETCTTGNPASSIQYPVSVNPNLPVSITISASANPFCQGSSVTFTGTPVNGGPTPSFQWQVNGVNVGTNNPNYTYNPSNGDLVSCILTSSETCTTNNPASSIQYPVSVSPNPIVTFTACFDTITTINAKPIKLKGGIPLGGTYSGPGVNSLTGIFDPSVAGVGTKTITYTYTNAVMCSALAHAHIINYPLSIINCGSPIIDIRDNKIYQTVQIGSQCWMAEDLNYGTEIPVTQDQRDNCVPEKYHNPASGIQHPASVYQWDEVMQYDNTPGNQGFCPPAWHIPTENDWNTLFANYVNNGFAGSPLKYSGYSGFNALLSGARHIDKSWDFQNFAAFFWSSTQESPTKAWSHGMNDPDPSVSIYPSSKSNAFSIRCVHD